MTTHMSMRIQESCGQVVAEEALPKALIQVADHTLVAKVTPTLHTSQTIALEAVVLNLRMKKLKKDGVAWL